MICIVTDCQLLMYMHMYIVGVVVMYKPSITDLVPYVLAPLYVYVFMTTYSI